MTTYQETCGPTRDARRHRHPRAAGEVPAGARQAAARRGIEAVSGAEGRVRGLLRGRSAHAGDAPRPDLGGHRRRRPRRWFRGPAGRGPPQEGRRRGCPHHRNGRRLRRRLVLEPLPGHPVRQRRLLLHPAARRTRLHADEEVRRRRRDLRALPRSGSISACTTARSSPPWCATLRWDESIKRWRVSTNRGDDIRARFVVMAAGSFNRPKLPGIPGIKDFKGHMFHSARWDYDYTGGDANGGWTSSPTSASRSSAPAPPAFSWCRISAEMPSTSTSSSARRRPSTSAATCRPTRNGRSRCSPAGRRSGKRNFHPGHRSRVSCSERRTWSATSGPS